MYKTFLLVAVAAALIALAACASECRSIMIQPSTGTCGGMNINTRVCAATDDSLRITQAAVTNYMNSIGTTTGCANLAALCSLGGSRSVPRPLKDGENMLPYCTPFSQCNYIRAGAVSSLCTTDDQCTGATSQYLPCCSSLRYWIRESCVGFDNTYMEGALIVPVCKNTDSDCYAFGSASSLSVSAGLPVLVALVSSLISYVMA